MKTEPNEPSKETIAQEAKRILELIPEEKWIAHNYTNEGECRCGMGHWNEYRTGNPWNCDYEPQLNNVIRKFADSQTIRSRFSLDVTMSLVNDGDVKAYPQNTPKKRVMALLDDMIAAGY